MTWSDIEGWFDFEDHYRSVVERYPGGTMVEVGCYLGRSLCCLGQMARDSGKPFRVVGVDWCVGSGTEWQVTDGKDLGPNDHHGAALARGAGTFAGELHRNVLACGLSDVVTLVVCDSIRAAELFADESLTMVFIDGRHDEENVCRDIAAWKPKVARGGVLSGHDYCDIWPGVKRAVERCCAGFTPVSHISWEWRK